ncbi:MAG: ligase-associated DNA damage response endonuclease PdeM [Pirellulales bacterium]|nr:ligase-associated DNA damage response endonuclease PdeM [Pirellulales bacterium]
MLTIELAGEEVRLLRERALFWPRQRTLFIADTHFGKAATFQSHGIPIPTGNTATDLARLAALLAATQAEELVILGDFWHAARGRSAETVALLAAWRAGCAEVSIRLIRGNHDRAAGDPPPEWNIACENPGAAAEPFTLAHEPLDQAGGYVLAGHLHPAIRLAESCGGGMRSPCFWVTPRMCVLPAFGGFTGAKCVTAVEGDRLFAIGPDEVVEVRTVTANHRPSRRKSTPQKT